MGNEIRYTLVQHTGYVVGRKPEFKRAVEMRSVSANAADRVRAAGGVVFDSYAAASEGEEAANYPPEVLWLIPCCRGTFAMSEVDGLKVYVPPKETT